MKLPTLYAKASNGNIKVWSIWTSNGSIFVEFGKLGGKLQIQQTDTLVGKNIGKANETTNVEQAELEAKSKWNKQVDRDYKESVEELEQSTLPPLAKKYQDAKHLLGEEYDALPKYDGVRCTLFHKDGKVTFQSRGGKSYPEIKEISEVLIETVWSDRPNLVLDLELYSHGMFLEDIVSAVKKTKASTDKIGAWIFDIHDPEEPEMVWEDRYKLYRSLEVYKTNNPSKHRVGLVAATRITCEADMLTFHAECVAKGLEGVVLRKLDGKFTFGHRTSDFQKYKVAMDEEFKVIRFEVDKNGCAIPWCAIDNSVDSTRTEFKAPLVGTRERQQKIAENQHKYIGKYITVVFESYTKYGIPGKPKGHNFREVDKDGNPIE